MRAPLPLSLLTLGLLLSACPEPRDPPPPTLPETPAAEDGGPSTELLPSPLESEPHCARVLSGPPGEGAPPVALSRLVGDVRFFGPRATYAEVDNALAAAMNDEALDEVSIVSLLGQALQDVCALEPTTTQLSAVQISKVGDVALIRPGQGEVTLPAGTRAVAIDLRGLPEVPELSAALDAALAPALQAELPKARVEVRQHQGHADQFSADPVYAVTLKSRPETLFAATGTEALPLALITGEGLAPTAARFAGTLRLHGRAQLLGSEVLAAVAESRWVSAQRSAFAFRSMNLRHGGQRWPDVIPADRPGAELAAALEALPNLGALQEVPLSAADRAPIARPNVTTASKSTLNRGSARAGLILAHAIARRFYPYLDVVGDSLDERLEEVIASVDAEPLNRRRNVQLVRRFGEALSDGHNFVGDLTGSVPYVGYAPFLVDHLEDGQPVVVASSDTQVEVGDVITHIDGMTTAEWYARELPRTSAASLGYKLSLASREYLLLEGPSEFGVRSPTGTATTVTVAPVSFEAQSALFERGQRRSGGLDAFSAPELFYLNLDSLGLDEQGDTCAGVLQQAAAAGATGMVLDMRGYPGEQGFGCLERLVTARSFSPWFHVPEISLDQAMTWDESRWWVDPTSAPNFVGPTVLLVGPSSVSAAETIATILVDAGRVKAVVGRPSAATNGNITYARLPGGVYFSFTGMKVLHTDGSRYHGLGILPDHVVVPTAEELASGVDSALLKAIEVLRAE